MFNINHINKPATHIKAWLIYIVYVYLLNLLTNKEINPLFIFIYVVPFIGLFYIFLLVLKLSNTSIYKIIFFIVTLFIIFLGVSDLLLVKILPYFGIVLTTNSFTISALIQSLILMFVKFLTYALLYSIINKLFDREKRLRNIKEEKHVLEIQKEKQALKNAELIQKELLAQKEKIQYQYAFLRAQINPHFLYNTLNVLFSKALPLSEELANNILKLSDLMRYSLDNVETENMKVPLQKEVEHLLTLLEIHSLRFSDSKFIDYKLNGSTENIYIPPLSIITIVENAIKYGDLSDPKFPLTIRIDTIRDLLHCMIRNKKNNNVKVMSHNVGLSNLRQRLDFAFKDKYEINIIDDDNFYTFEITVKK